MNSLLKDLFFDSLSEELGDWSQFLDILRNSKFFTSTTPGVYLVEETSLKLVIGLNKSYNNNLKLSAYFIKITSNKRLTWEEFCKEASNDLRKFVIYNIDKFYFV